MLSRFALGIVLGFVVVYGAGSCGAHAAETFSRTCDRHGCNSVFGYTDGADARIITLPSQEGSPRDKAWEAFCQPREERGEHGIIYLRYAHVGCEYGRTR